MKYGLFLTIKSRITTFSITMPLTKITEILDNNFPEVDASIVMDHLGIDENQDLIQKLGDQQFVQDFIGELGQQGVNPEMITNFLRDQNISLGDFNVGDLLNNKDELLDKAGDILGGILGK